MRQWQACYVRYLGEWRGSTKRFFVRQHKNFNGIRGKMMSKETNNQNSNRKIIRRDRLRQLRNEIDFSHLFRRLGWPWKRRDDGVILFVCPECSESETSVNPKTNLARCFRCEMNWNTIDFTKAVGRMEFLEAYGFLEEMLPRPPDHTTSIITAPLIIA